MSYKSYINGVDAEGQSSLVEDEGKVFEIFLTNNIQVDTTPFLTKTLFCDAANTTTRRGRTVPLSMQKIVKKLCGVQEKMVKKHVSMETVDCCRAFVSVLPKLLSTPNYCESVMRPVFSKDNPQDNQQQEDLELWIQRYSLPDLRRLIEFSEQVLFPLFRLVLFSEVSLGRYPDEGDPWESEPEDLQPTHNCPSSVSHILSKDLNEAAATIRHLQSACDFIRGKLDGFTTNGATYGKNQRHVLVVKQASKLRLGLGLDSEAKGSLIGNKEKKRKTIDNDGSEAGSEGENEEERETTKRKTSDDVQFVGMHCPAMGARCFNKDSQSTLETCICTGCKRACHKICYSASDMKCMICAFSKSTRKPRDIPPKVFDRVPPDHIYFQCPNSGCEWATPFRTETAAAKELKETLFTTGKRSKNRYPIDLQSDQVKAFKFKSCKLSNHLDFIAAKRHFYSCYLARKDKYKSRDDIPQDEIPNMFIDQRFRRDDSFKPENWRTFTQKQKNEYYNKRKTQLHAKAVRLLKQTYESGNPMNWSREMLKDLLPLGSLASDKTTRFIS